MGRRPARPRAGAAAAPGTAPPACSSPASTTRRQHRGTSQPGASWVLPLDAIDRLGAVPGRAHERPATHRRPRRAGAAGRARLVRVRVDQVGHPRSSGSAATPRPRPRCASSPAARIRTACRHWRATTRPRPSTPPRCRSGSSSAASTAASNTAWSASSGAARSPWTVCSSASAPRDPGTPFAICPAPRTHHTWSLWTYRWRPAEPGVLRHRAARGRPHGPHAASRPLLLRSSGPHRRDLTPLPRCLDLSRCCCSCACCVPRPPGHRISLTTKSGSRPWRSAGCPRTGARTSRCGRAGSTTPRISGW